MTRVVPRPIAVSPAGAAPAEGSEDDETATATTADVAPASATPKSCDPPPLPGLLTGDKATFSAPWEARAFAMVVSMAEAKRFTWGEWVATFSREVAAAEAAAARGETPRTYYEQWLDAVEKLMVAKGLTTDDQLRLRRFAFAGGASVLLRTRDD